MKILIKYISSAFFIHFLGFSIYIVFTSFFNFDPVLVAIIASPFLIFLNYLMQLNFVFQKQNSSIILIRYLTLLLSQYFLNIVLLYIMVHELNLHHIYSQLFIILLLFGINFFLSKRYVYTSK